MNVKTLALVRLLRAIVIRGLGHDYEPGEIGMPHRQPVVDSCLKCQAIILTNLAESGDIY